MRSIKHLTTVFLVAALILPMFGNSAIWPFAAAQEGTPIATLDDFDPVDLDGDAIASDIDNCAEIANPDQLDSDADSIGDACDPTPLGDPDTDGDGIADEADNCADNANPDQIDIDGDGIGDTCDPTPMGDSDMDGDGIADQSDDCATTGNSELLDSDQNGIDNACDDASGADAATIPTDEPEESIADDVAESAQPTNTPDVAVYPANTYTEVINFAEYDPGSWRPIPGGCVDLWTYDIGEDLPISFVGRYCDADDGASDGDVALPGLEFKVAYLPIFDPPSGWKRTDCRNVHIYYDDPEELTVGAKVGVYFAPGEDDCNFQPFTTIPTETSVPATETSVPPTNTPTATPTSTRTATPTVVATTRAGVFPIGSIVRPTTSLSVRTGPGTGNSRIGIMRTWMRGTITGPPVPGGGWLWYPIAIPGIGNGYSAGEYLRLASGTAATATPTSAPATSTTTSGSGGIAAGSSVATTTRLNLRIAPSIGSRVILVLPAAAHCLVIGSPVVMSGYTWYPVTCSRFGEGYVVGNYLRLAVSPTATSVAIATRTPVVAPTQTAAASCPIVFGIGTAVRTTATVNMRTGPGLRYRVVTVVSNRTSAKVTGSPTNFSGFCWYPVIVTDGAHTGKTGWIAGRYLAATTPPPATSVATLTRTPVVAPTQTTAASCPIVFGIGTAVRTTATVNMRTGPGLRYRVVTVVSNRTSAKVTGSPTNFSGFCWYPVIVTGGAHTGKTGWIAGRYLAATTPPPASTVPATVTTVVATTTASTTATPEGSPIGTIEISQTPTSTPTPSGTPDCGEIIGQITNSTTGQPISGATVISGDQTTASDEAGNYMLTCVSAGSRQLFVSANGFASGQLTVMVPSNSSVHGNVSLVPSTLTDQITVVLTWNENPLDLDSHMSGPIFDSGDRFHIAYFDTAPVSYASLDVDDVTSFGPETVTIIKTTELGIFVEGDYHYWVHNFSTSPEFDVSSATVTVYKDSTQIAQFSVNGAGGSSADDLWHVFDLQLDAAGNVTIIPVQSFLPGDSGTVL